MSVEIQWGAEIAVNGVRPDWLRDREAMNWRSREDREWYGVNSGGYTDEEWVDPIHYIRLPATHPYYIATSRGFTYWPGGESAPEDWDGGEVLWGDGEVDTAGKWDRDHSYYLIIIGYRKRTEQNAPAIGPALVERMRKLVLDVAADHRISLTAMQTEARDILKALDPVDEDTVAATAVREMYAKGDAGNLQEAFELAIKRGREPERECGEAK